MFITVQKALWTQNSPNFKARLSSNAGKCRVILTFLVIFKTDGRLLSESALRSLRSQSECNPVPKMAPNESEIPEGPGKPGASVRVSRFIP